MTLNANEPTSTKSGTRPPCSGVRGPTALVWNRTKYRNHSINMYIFSTPSTDDVGMQIRQDKDSRGQRDRCVFPNKILPIVNVVSSLAGRGSFKDQYMVVWLKPSTQAVKTVVVSPFCDWELHHECHLATIHLAALPGQTLAAHLPDICYSPCHICQCHAVPLKNWPSSDCW